uniref:Uncharacterized protein n=1 Tax=Candidatus Kentrum sp. UNK TaxID=2126344 RepID=A0A451AU02_9GAMM|nr:MAG: hypothetical protein BECKUNK1418G_GA0071005_101423 [Candidatus Kentron sp. UNK]VFK69524.1 MAG: hypothetical protein BECKUNK1418H_GA0071006_101522 [Candidatus Kentron sp. UNK]
MVDARSDPPYASTFFICWGDETLNMIVSLLSRKFSTKRSKNMLALRARTQAG